jgi:hypothetical protein
MTFAHIAGVPVEEGLLALAPVAGVLAVFVAAPLRRLGRYVRRPRARAMVKRAS